MSWLLPTADGLLSRDATWRRDPTAGEAMPMSEAGEDDEARLLAASAVGDEQAFVAVYRRWQTGRPDPDVAGLRAS